MTHDYITTYSGIRFNPTAPEPDGICITDIAHALSLLCRGNGHVQRFFSVGQHCIHCALEAEARNLPPRLCLACLLHDGAEAYLSDITRPVKKHLHNYAGYEQTLLDMIYRKYLGSTLAPDEERIVKHIDDDMLYFDLRDLLKEPVPEPEPVMCSTFTYEVIPFEKTEQTYLALFHRWYPA